MHAGLKMNTILPHLAKLSSPLSSSKIEYTYKAQKTNINLFMAWSKSMAALYPRVCLKNCIIST